MELQQLRYFQAVAHFEHFTRAAEALYISEPSINRAIARLERELGAPLFDRQGRRIRLNQLGRAFQRRVERVFSELEEGQREIYDLLEPERGLVTVAFPHTVGVQLLPNLLHAFRTQHPTVRFHLTQTATQPQMLGQLEGGEVDLSIAMPFEARQHIHWIHLLTEELYLAVSPEHWLARHKRIALREVADDPFISLKSAYSTRMLADNLCRQAGFEPTIAFEGEEFATVKGLVSAGLGVALIPQLAWKGQAEQSPVPVHVEEPACQRQLGLAWREDRYLSAAAVLFQQFLIAHFAEYAGLL